MFALATDPGIDVLLLDEPDAHLHSSLQEQLLDSLRSMDVEISKQVLIATHSRLERLSLRSAYAT